mgnify:CR=1 FL=1
MFGAARRLRGDSALSLIYTDSSFNTQAALSPDSRRLYVSIGSRSRVAPGLIEAYDEKLKSIRAGS